MKLSKNAQIINDNLIARWNIYNNTELSAYAYLQDLYEYEKGLKFIKDNYLITDKELEFLTKKIENLSKTAVADFKKKVGIE